MNTSSLRFFLFPLVLTLSSCNPVGQKESDAAKQIQIEDGGHLNVQAPGGESVVVTLESEVLLVQVFKNKEPIISTEIKDEQYASNMIGMINNGTVSRIVVDNNGDDIPEFQNHPNGGHKKSYLPGRYED